MAGLVRTAFVVSSVVGITFVLMLSGVSGSSLLAHNLGSDHSTPGREYPALRSGGAYLELNGKKNSNSGPAPTSVLVAGFGFPPLTTANLTLYNPSVPSYNLDGGVYPYNGEDTGIPVSSSGQFSTDYEIPVVQNNTYDFTATDLGTSATATFKVTTPASSFNHETFSVRGGSVHAGGDVVLNGTGFYPDDVENLYLGNTTGFFALPTFDNNGNGNISFRLHIANATLNGTYTLFIVGDTEGYGAATLNIIDTDGGGYFAYNDSSLFSVTGVSGAWVQPAVTCPPSGGANASFWVGLNGVLNPAAERIGTLARCTDGIVTYSAFWQVTPFRLGLQSISTVAVAPGDAVSASVTYDGITNTFTLKIKVNGVSFTKKVSEFEPTNSAECLAGSEAPHEGAMPSPLANFGSVTFSSCKATVGGHTATVGSFANAPLDVLSWLGVQLTSNSALGSGGSFTVSVT